MQRSQYRGCIWIAIFSAIPVLVLRPFQDTPFIDDWVYAWSVEHLLRTGELRFLDISTSINLAQVFWGTLFCLPFGFSFPALRVSTWSLAVFGLCGLYLLLRELDVSRRDAFIGTAVLAVYPVFFILSFTFMTDVPFLALMIWFCFSLVKTIRGKNDAWLVTAACFACAASAVRIPGAGLSMAMLATLIFNAGAWGRRWFRLLIPVICVILFFVMVWWHSSHTEYRADLTWQDGSPTERIADLKWAFLWLHLWVVGGLTFLVGALGTALVPLALGCCQRKHLVRGISVCLTVLLLFAVQIWFDRAWSAPLTPGSTWSLFELGATEPLVPNRIKPEMPQYWIVASAFASTVLFSLALAPPLQRQLQRGVGGLLWVIGGQYALLTILWLFSLLSG